MKLGVIFPNTSCAALPLYYSENQYKKLYEQYFCMRFSKYRNNY